MVTLHGFETRRVENWPKGRSYPSLCTRYVIDTVAFFLTDLASFPDLSSGNEQSYEWQTLWDDEERICSEQAHRQVVHVTHKGYDSVMNKPRMMRLRRGSSRFLEGRCLSVMLKLVRVVLTFLFLCICTYFQTAAMAAVTVSTTLVVPCSMPCFRSSIPRPVLCVILPCFFHWTYRL